MLKAAVLMKRATSVGEAVCSLWLSKWPERKNGITPRGKSSQKQVPFCAGLSCCWSGPAAVLVVQPEFGQAQCEWPEANSANWPDPKGPCSNSCNN